ncbi:MAG: UbiA family prenyltransferase [Candidatus Thorarchaeota archaeon]
MIRKTLLFRNLVDNIPKNVGLYSVGILLLIISGFAFDAVGMIPGLVAFIISYSSVYVLNDIFDISEDERDLSKRMRKPLALGSVEKPEAIVIYVVLLVTGLMLSLFQNLAFFAAVSVLIIINALYSIPILVLSKTQPAPNETDKQNRRSLKYTIAGLPLVFVMQFLKLLLPWTLTTELTKFPFLFACGFSLTYLVIFKGYKANYTIGESIIHEAQLFGAAVVFFVLSMLMHQGPVLQASVFLYLLAGIALFRNLRLVDKKVILLSPIYILLGIIILYCLVLVL